MKHYIYKITNLVNSKYYIGAHCGELDDAYLGSGIAIAKAIKKHGKENFKKEVLCVCTNSEAMYFMEKVFVGQEEVDDKKCYNMKTGGIGGIGLKHSEEARKKMSEAKIGKKFSDEHKQKIGDAKMGNTNTLGLKHSAETCKKMSDAKIGKKFSVEHKQKLSEASRWRKFPPLSEETKQKLSAAQMGENK